LFLKSIELFGHAAPELKHTLNAQGVLGIPLGIEQKRGLHARRDGDEFADWLNSVAVPTDQRKEAQRLFPRRDRSVKPRGRVFCSPRKIVLSASILIAHAYTFSFQTG
jgi:hypothetical protein